MKKDNTTRIIYILRQMNRKIKLITERLRRRLWPRLMSYKTRPGMSGAGFVLPTVTMVMLVVILLTVAISLRSFNRVEDARNVRVNQAVLSAAAPALDRAKAKLEELLVTNPPTTGTPSEDTIEIALNEGKFDFGDEERLTVSYGGETTQTAWRFRVDTDGDGTDDAYTIYGIFFKTPGEDRARTPLEARVPPQSSEVGSDNECPGVLATSKEWIPIDGKLKKSFFVYAVTVQDDNKSGVSALEYQQDWSRTPLTNNAVVYEDDLEIAPGINFNLNGRIFTNSNLIIGPTGDGNIRSFLVSSPKSCFYLEADNSKIFVGGNLLYGFVERTTNIGRGDVTIDLMNGGDQDSQNLTAQNDSVNTTAQQAAYNSAAYRERLDALKTAVVDSLAGELVDGSGKAKQELPQEVQDKINEGNDGEDALETYFRKLTRKVPNAENGCTTELDPSDSSCIGIEGTGDDLRPSLQDILVLPDDDTTGVDLEIANLAITDPPPADDTVQNQLGDRIEVGNNLPQQYWDGSGFTNTQTLENGRVRTSQVETLADVGSTDRDGFWEVSAADAPENASEGIGGLRVITGAGIYDRTNSFLPPPPAPPNMPAGYQVVWPDTMPMSPVEGSIIYDYDDTDPNTIWREYDPVADSDVKGDLQMRATVLYHYAQDSGENRKVLKNPDGTETVIPFDPQEPIACISSYYDPSTAITAQNGAGGRSNNGIVYPKPTSTISGRQTELETQSKLVFPDGRLVNEPLKVALEHEGGNDFTLADKAAIDAELCALDILGGAAPSSIITGLSEGAIREVSFLDSRQVKALDVDDPDTVIDETFTVNALINPTIADYEKDDTDTTPGYLADDPTTTDVDESEVVFRDIEGGDIVDQRLPLEERQPLEIRATVLDLDILRKATLSQTVSAGPSEEYLLPMSGIIYASRNDALPDRTDPDSTYNNLGISPEDFDLDPSRRPNGFMLINGDKLARGDDSKSYDTLSSITQEKGLLFISNNPVYIKGNFNRHDFEEFTERLQKPTLDSPNTAYWDNFYTRETKEDNFACRKGDPRTNVNCTTGDPWRAATVLADAVTLLSDNWQPGYRNHGDFDLRNNGGNGIIGPDMTMRQKRQFNGFFNNNYATNGLSSQANIAIDNVPANNVALTDTTYTTKQAGRVNSSYFNNFVTPVQRRINGFPEYVMEVCPKLPVSACNAGDWIVDWELDGDEKIINQQTMYDLLSDTDNDFNDGTNDYFANGLLRDDIEFDSDILASSIAANTLESGTTATIETDPPNPVIAAEVQRFPRRIAFLRNQYGELEMREIVDGTDVRYTPIPIGVNGDGDVQAYPYPNTATFTGPRTANNALWFRTTTNFNGQPFQNATYAADEPLFYLNYDEGDRDHSGNRPILPPTPEINGVSLIEDDDVLDDDDAYNYSFCGGDISQDYYAISDELDNFLASGTCPAATNINNFRQALINITSSDDDTGASPSISVNGTKVMGDTDQDGIVVYEEASFASGATIELDGDSDDIFVIRTPSGENTMTFADDVTLSLVEGVNPNNIFWVSNGGTTFNDATNATVLTGNFLGNTALTIGENTKILGGRFLGFTTTGINDVASIPAGVDIRAITDAGYPSLVPVLQINEPDSTTVPNNLGGNNASTKTAWMVEAQETTFNLIVGSGDTPARAGQGNGGLQNFVRFQENWKNPREKATNISGAFIQLDRSKYATAPQQQIIVADREDTFDDSPYKLFGYPFIYRSGAAQGILGFQTPPARNWGFDVGLLSQPPDLFAQKFTLPPSDDPDEFFREVGIDDDWIRGLLCSQGIDVDNPEAHRPSGTDCTGYE